jgi:uncharacterized ferredoxin-like protein
VKQTIKTNTSILKMKTNPETENLEQILRQLLISARTAPKAKGEDSITTVILEPEDVEKVAKEMEGIARRGEKFKFFLRDAENLRNSDGCVLIGVKTDRGLGLNCGACGVECSEITRKMKKEDYNGPNCAFKLIDLGIAVGSFVKNLSALGIDNRIMYSVGLAAKRAGLTDADVVLAVPVSVKGKNIFFDRRS